MDYQKSLFIFRRDLRLNDNTALNEALKNSQCVVACFIFDPRQVSFDNEFRSPNALKFMVESLQDLQEQLQHNQGFLYYFYGVCEDVVEKLLHQESFDAVYINRDYTPFSIKRDAAIEKNCVKEGKAFYQYDDALLNPPESIKNGNNEAYSVFTSYYKKALQHSVNQAKKIIEGNFYREFIRGHQDLNMSDFIQHKKSEIAVYGGTIQARLIFENLKAFKNYAQERDFPALATTHLSAHNKFGTVSIREVYHAIIKKLGVDHPLIRQLYWRDFFTSVAYFSPFVFGHPFHKKYENLEWSTNNEAFDRWCSGTTGFPLVDAAMRQMNHTGFMHNRSRLIVGSFLVKDLHINWMWGEKYFAQNLVDYDPCVNNGNWQWVASTGCDSQPYFRIFNPWLQQKKFDPECIYIKRWVPELKNISNVILHSWFKEHEAIKGYPRPMIDHGLESKKTKLLYSR